MERVNVKQMMWWRWKENFKDQWIINEVMDVEMDCWMNRWMMNEVIDVEKENCWMHRRMMDEVMDEEINCWMKRWMNR